MLTSRKWEELDAFNTEDESAFVDQGDESENFGDGGALAAGRRGMIEQALARVREVARTPIEAHRKYSAGTLVFDAEKGKFGRVKKSNSALIVEFFSGGTKEYGPSHGKGTIKESVSQPQTTQVKAASTSVPKNSKPSFDAKKDLKLDSKDLKKAADLILQNDRELLKAKVPDKKSSAKKEIIQDKKSVKPIKKDTGVVQELQLDPVADPNGYIRKNYSYLSNKQLATLTGFSEHTIRRKLGEWGLKRNH